jgi:hypothetical protein
MELFFEDYPICGHGDFHLVKVTAVEIFTSEMPYQELCPPPCIIYHVSGHDRSDR